VQWHSEGNSSLEVRLGVKGAVSVNVDHDLAGAVAKRCYVSRSVWGHLFSSESSRRIRKLLPPPTMIGRPACQVGSTTFV
jgi:hypothetical protein